jgi:hypothetical protein
MIRLALPRRAGLFIFAAISNEHEARPRQAARFAFLDISRMFATLFGEHAGEVKTRTGMESCLSVFASIRGEHRGATKMFNCFDPLVQ